MALSSLWTGKDGSKLAANIPLCSEEHDEWVDDSMLCVSHTSKTHTIGAQDSTDIREQDGIKLSATQTGGVGKYRWLV